MGNRKSVLIEAVETRLLFAIGDLDSTFGNGGMVGLGVSNPASDIIDERIYPQADGSSYFIATHFYLVPYGVTNHSYGGLQKLDASGALVKSFGVNGEVSLPENWHFSDLTVEANGNIVTIGSALGGGYVERFDPAGKVVGFSWLATSPYAQTGFGNSLSSVINSGDGGFYIAGAFKDTATNLFQEGIAKIHSDGSPDTTFGNNGFSLLSAMGLTPSLGIPLITRLVRASNGDLAVAGKFTSATSVGGFPDSVFVERVSGSTGALIDTEATLNGGSANALFTLGGLAVTSDNRIVFSVTNASGGTTPTTTEVRTKSSSGNAAGDFFGTQAASVTTGRAASLEAVGNSVFYSSNAVHFDSPLTGNIIDSANLTKIDSFGSGASVHKSYLFNGKKITIEGTQIAGGKLYIDGRTYSSSTGSDIQDGWFLGRVLTDSQTISKPAAPDNLGTQVVTTKSVKLNWSDNSNNETGFKIERRYENWIWGQVAIVGANTTSYTETGLFPGVIYEYRVRATNTAGDSDYTNLAKANMSNTTTVDTTAPSNLKSTTSNHQVKLTWKDNTSNETKFVVERRYSNWVWDTTFTASANTTSFTDTSVWAGVEYEYRIKAVTASGETQYSGLALIQVT